jgi:uncharacterized membrane protein
MKSARLATIVSTVAAILLMANHAWVGRVIAGLVVKDGVGVELPRHVGWLIKLDHVFVGQFYVLIPVLWIATFLVAVAVRGWFPTAKPAGEHS